jgi:maltose O-acetyltransferase
LLSTLRRVLRKANARLRRRTDVETLKERGLTVGADARIVGEVFIDPDFCDLISIGDNTTISADVMILAHDGSTKRLLGYTRIAPVQIGSRVFVGARAIILPGVTIGDDAIVGAGSIVTRDVPAATVVAGNPARHIADTETYIGQHSAAMAERPVWGWDYSIHGGVTPDKRLALREGGEGYIR